MAILLKYSIVRLSFIALTCFSFIGLHTKDSFSKPIQAGQKQISGRSATPQAWALATTAILFERNGQRHDLLGGCVPSRENVTTTKQTLSQWWGINNRADLLNTLNWIETGGHRESFEKLGAYLASLNKQQFSELSAKIQHDEEARHQVDIAKKYYGKFAGKSLLGWDYARYISLCRWGCLVGYLTEKEAWGRIMPAAAMLQRNFISWKDLGENYLVGRQFWSYGQTQRDGQLYQNVYRQLLSKSSSPWILIPWNLNLRVRNS